MLRKIHYDENLSVKVELLNIHSYPIHNHKDFQIIYVLEGELSLKLFYYTYCLQPGSIHIIHSEDVHSIKSITKNNLVLVLSFDRNYFQSIFPHFITTVFVTNIEADKFEKSAALKDQIFTIVSEEYERDSGYVSRINNAAVALINTLMNNFRGFVIDPAEKAFIHKTSHDYIQVDRISRIIQYVYENYPYKITLSEIADREQISPYYLSHVFHKLVGLNFRDFLSMVRVEMSEAAVLSTDRSITQIAQDVGFSDAKYYISHFYEHLGYHPKEYRKIYSGQILSALDPDVEEYNLDRLKDIIGKYTQYPVFKDVIDKVTSVEFDFCASSQYKFTVPKISEGIPDELFNDLISDSCTDFDMSKLYGNITPQKSAVELLQKLTCGPETFRYPHFSLVDTQKTSYGLLTPNGLKKPMYYLLMILKSLPDEIVSIGPNYITLQQKSTKFILAFNPDSMQTLTLDIVARNINASYKVTKYILRASSSCLNSWAGLNFMPKLEAEDKNNINYMSRPEIGYELVPHSDQYYSSIELDPFDIILLKFTKC